MVGKKASNLFMDDIGKQPRNLNSDQMLKKQMKPLYQLVFALVNKVILPRAERHSFAALADLYPMEGLVNFSPVNLSCIMIEHITKICDLKGSSHGLGYGFLLTRVFDHFKVECKQRTASTRK